MRASGQGESVLAGSAGSRVVTRRWLSISNVDVRLGNLEMMDRVRVKIMVMPQPRGGQHFQQKIIHRLRRDWKTAAAAPR